MGCVSENEDAEFCRHITSALDLRKDKSIAGAISRALDRARQIPREANVRYNSRILFFLFPTMLTPEQRAQYDRDGFIVLPDFKDAAQIAALRARAEAIVDAFDPDESRAIFTTQRPGTRHATTSSSVRTTRCAASSRRKPLARTASCARPKALSINKIGHAMHDLDPVFDAFSHEQSWPAWRATWAWRSRGLPVPVHLQAARHRRRSALAPGCDLLRYRSDQRDHLLVRAGRRDGR